jgi:hypothetical protein
VYTLNQKVFGHLAYPYKLNLSAGHQMKDVGHFLDKSGFQAENCLGTSLVPRAQTVFGLKGHRLCRSAA